MSSGLRPHRLLTASLCCSVFLGGLAARTAHASGPAEFTGDATTLVGLEQRAAAAEPKDRCYLYTELLHSWTELAGRAMTDGDDANAAAYIAHADQDVARLKGALNNDSKRLKNAELLLEGTAHHLADMVRVASGDQQGSMRAVLRHLDTVHDALLAQIFAH